MSKLENASGNLKEILCAIADGEKVQYWADPDRKWQTLHSVAFAFALDEDGIKLKWRRKPDAFERWWGKSYVACEISARIGWNAAMEHKADE